MLKNRYGGRLNEKADCRNRLADRLRRCRCDAYLYKSASFEKIELLGIIINACAEYSVTSPDAFPRLEGVGRFTVGGKVFLLGEGETIIMPEDIPHAVFGEEKFRSENKPQNR